MGRRKVFRHLAQWNEAVLTSTNPPGTALKLSATIFALASCSPHLSQRATYCGFGEVAQPAKRKSKSKVFMLSVVI